MLLHFEIQIRSPKAGLCRKSRPNLALFTPVKIRGELGEMPLDNIRVMVIVWRLRGNIIRTAPCWVV